MINSILIERDFVLYVTLRNLAARRGARYECALFKVLLIEKCSWGIIIIIDFVVLVVIGKHTW